MYYPWIWGPYRIYCYRRQECLVVWQTVKPLTSRLPQNLRKVYQGLTGTTTDQEPQSKFKTSNKKHIRPADREKEREREREKSHSESVCCVYTHTHTHIYIYIYIYIYILPYWKNRQELETFSWHGSTVSVLENKSACSPIVYLFIYFSAMLYEQVMLKIIM